MIPMIRKIRIGITIRVTYFRIIVFPWVSIKFFISTEIRSEFHMTFPNPQLLSQLLSHSSFDLCFKKRSGRRSTRRL